MHRRVSIVVVQLVIVIHVLMSAGAAGAQMKVACVGDSITALPSGWCGYLGTDLGSGYTAMTFGVSGTTLLKNTGGLGSYFDSSGYKPSHDFAPNIVVIMLGTNDSMPRNWDAGKSHFVADYKELIMSYTSLATKPMVILNTAPPASDDNMFTISGTTIEKEVNPLIKQVAMEMNCPLADVWAALGGDVKKLGSSDGVHPGADGSKLIADAVYKTIMMPVVPGGSAGGGGSAGAAGGGANTSGAGVGGAVSSANTSGAGASGASGGGAVAHANTGGASGGTAPGGKVTGASGSTGSKAAGGSSSLPGAAGSTTTGTTSSGVNTTAGTNAPVTTAPPSSGGGGCQMVNNSTTHHGPMALLLFVLGIAIRSRRRALRAKAIVQPAVVVLILCASAGIANAQVKVACVGDSITALPSSWCGDLSTKLGSGYTVMNFGVSGTNLAKNVSQPYWDSAEYTPSHTFAPNIVIIMLGTNDAFDASWSSAKSHFVKDYEELLDTYTSLASKPKPYMIIPTPIGTSPFGHDGKLLETDVIPLIKQVAMEKMVPTIDAFTLFGGSMFDAGLYGGSDQVHPNAKGQQMICDEVYKVLMSTGALGGPAGGSAGSAGSATAGSGAMATAGAGANAGSGAKAGSGGTATASGSAGASAGAGSTITTPTGAGGGGGNRNTGSTANAAGSTATSPTGVAGRGSAGGNASSTNGIATAGASAPPMTAPSSSGGGCQMVGNSERSGGPTAAFILLLGLAVRSKKKRSTAA